MASNAEIIATFRTLIKEHTDDNLYTDAYLFRILTSAKNLLYKRKLDKFKKLSEWEWTCFCIPLCIDKSHNCKCVKVGCNVLKTKFKLPRTLTSRNKDLIRITTLDNTEIPLIREREHLSNMLDPVMSKTVTASVIDGYLVIWNTLKLKGVQVCGVWDDITQWDGIQLCDIAGNETECFDINSLPFNIDGEIEYPMYQMGLELMRITLQKPEDITNDASSTIRV
jgi:hypothetical protein